MATFWRDAKLPRRPSRTVALKQSERRFQAQVTACARLRGWLVYHTYDSRRSESGWPDLVLCRPPRVIFAELKTNTGVVTDAQQAWLDALTACGLDVQVWRPVEWLLIDAYLV